MDQDNNGVVPAADEPIVPAEMPVEPTEGETVAPEMTDATEATEESVA
jgi:hypothetical protein